MRDRLPSLITVALLITLVVGTWWSAHYTMSTIEIDPPRKLTHEPDAWAHDFIMLRTNPTGEATNRLEGDYFEHYPDDDSYFIVEAVATGIRPERPVTIGRSDEAVMDEDGARITMQGNAHVHRVPTEDRAALDIYRSEERRVGKECRSWWFLDGETEIDRVDACGSTTSLWPT